MLTKDEVIKILRKELSYLGSEYSVERIGLFGSYAKGTQAEISTSALERFSGFER